MAVKLHNIHKISLLFHINTIVCGKRGYSLINICSLDLEASVCVCVHTFCLTGLIVYLILQCISIVSDPASLCLFRWLESVMSVFLMAVMAFGLQSCSCFNPILFCHFLCAFSVNCLNRWVLCFLFCTSPPPPQSSLWAKSLLPPVCVAVIYSVLHIFWSTCGTTCPWNQTFNRTWCPEGTKQ